MSQGNKLESATNQPRKATNHIVIMLWRLYLEKSGNALQKQDEIRRYMLAEFVKHRRVYR